MEETYGIFTEDGNVKTLTEDEILGLYGIDKLNLKELQSKYIYMVDEYDEKIEEYEERINDSENKYEELYNKFSNLEETINNLDFNIEEKNIDNSYLILFLIIGIIIAFFVGRFSNKKEV